MTAPRPSTVSDAIAGVINFELKDYAEGGTVEARWGQHYEGDGDGFNFAGNIGLPHDAATVFST